MSWAKLFRAVEVHWGLDEDDWFAIENTCRTNSAGPEREEIQHFQLQGEATQPMLEDGDE